MQRPSNPSLNDAVRDMVDLSGPEPLDAEERWRLRHDAAAAVGITPRLLNVEGKLLEFTEASVWDTCTGLDRDAWESTRSWLALSGLSRFEVGVLQVGGRDRVVFGRLGDALAESLTGPIAKGAKQALPTGFVGWLFGYGPAMSLAAEVASSAHRVLRRDFSFGPGVAAVSGLLDRWRRETARAERAARSRGHAERRIYHRITT